MKITFCVVAYNEEKYLPKLLKNLISQTYPHNSTEVVLVDGISTDSTKQIMMDFKEKYENEFLGIKVLDNPKKTLPCGWNVALENYTGDAILRVDAHAEIPSDFIVENINCINKGEKICGGKVISELSSKKKISEVINNAENSMFGGSFAAFRRADTEKYVDTIGFATYKREVFDKVGLYNEHLSRTEDNEMHYRMKKAGFKFFYTPKIISYRETRPNFSKLLNQKFLNGYWIGLTMGINPKCFSLYHFIPFLFVLGIIFTTALYFLGINFLGNLMWSAYGSLCILMTALTFINSKNILNILLPFMFFMLHIYYGVGTLVGLIKMPFWKRGIEK